MLGGSRAALTAGRNIQSAVIFGGSDASQQNMRALLAQGVNVAYVALTAALPNTAQATEPDMEVSSSSSSSTK